MLVSDGSCETDMSSTLIQTSVAERQAVKHGPTTRTVQPRRVIQLVKRMSQVYRVRLTMRTGLSTLSRFTNSGTFPGLVK